MDKNELSQLRYTSREYLSIFEDLYKAIPSLTTKWTSKEETDPGIVLVKLMAMLGDMLSYNQDKQSLEVYPATVTQRKNANQIFGLIGYKLHWYRSATCTGVFKNSGNNSSETIPPYSSFTTSNNITYTNLESIYIAGGSSAVLTQGIPIKPPTKSSPIGNNWYDAYEYNIDASDIVDNRYYLDKDNSIAEGSVFLVDNTGEDGESGVVWSYPDSTSVSQTRLDLEASSGRFFEVNVDEYDTPYIQFHKNWNKDVDVYKAPGKFRLFYVKSAGSNGSINANTLSDPDKRLISNTASTLGYDPETPEEARLNIDKYRNTIDTIITIDDFKNASLRIKDVSNCIATDAMTDLHTVNSNIVRLYVIPSDQISSGNDTVKEEFKSSILDILQDFKCVPITTEVYLPDDIIDGAPAITMYPWKPTGEIYLTEPVSTLVAQEILTNIDTRLRYVYSYSNIEFNTPINYMELINEIMEADARVKYVNLDPITYGTDGSGTAVLAKHVSGKVSGEGTINGTEVSFNIGKSLTPGSILTTVYIDNLKYEIRDSGYGSMVTVPYLSRADKLESGTVNYQTGEISLKFIANVSTITPTVTATINKVGICSYIGIDSSFTVSSDSIR